MQMKFWDAIGTIKRIWTVYSCNCLLHIEMKLIVYYPSLKWYRFQKGFHFESLPWLNCSRPALNALLSKDLMLTSRVSSSLSPMPTVFRKLPCCHGTTNKIFNPYTRLYSVFLSPIQPWSTPLLRTSLLILDGPSTSFSNIYSWRLVISYPRLFPLLLHVRQNTLSSFIVKMLPMTLAFSRERVAATKYAWV